MQEDELPIFRELDRLPEMLTVSDLCGRFKSLIVFADDSSNLVLLSKVRCGPIFSFQVILTNDGILQSCYMKTDLVKIPYLQRSKLSSWSSLEAVINYLTLTENDSFSVAFIE